MRKILLTTAAVAALSSSAFADSAMNEDSVYLRLDVIGSKFNKQNLAPLLGAVDYTANANFGMDVGVGYRVMENLRTELVYNHVFNPIFKSAAGAAVKPSAHAVMVRAFLDANVGVVQPYAGVALGWSQVKSLPGQKQQNNFAWGVHLGVGIPVTDGVAVDVGYRYTDYGKGVTTINPVAGVVAMRGHMGSIGLRFDL